MDHRGTGGAQGTTGTGAATGTGTIGDRGDTGVREIGGTTMATTETVRVTGQVMLDLLTTIGAHVLTAHAVRLQGCTVTLTAGQGRTVRHLSPFSAAIDALTYTRHACGECARLRREVIAGLWLRGRDADREDE